jgi:L-amino acid N-acyltransferase YncA
MPEAVATRAAVEADAGAIVRIFNQGIAERVATLETRDASAEAIREAIAAGTPMLVAEHTGAVVGFARIGPYSDPHPYYAGIGEATLYVERAARGSGAGRALMEDLATEATRRGLHKLVGKIFTSNEPSIALVHSCGWRDVGVHLRHGKLDAEWKDVLVVELLLGDPAA